MNVNVADTTNNTMTKLLEQKMTIWIHISVMSYINYYVQHVLLITQHKLEGLLPSDLKNTVMPLKQILDNQNSPITFLNIICSHLWKISLPLYKKFQKKEGIAHTTVNILNTSHWEILPHPLYRPDFTPSDFHPFPKIKKHLHGLCF